MKAFVGLIGALALAVAAAGVGHAAEGAVDCFEQARKEPSLTDLDRVRLCRDALSTAPADCYVEARARTFFGSHDALRLCTFARSTAPADCAAEAERGTFLAREDVLRLCRNDWWGFP